MHIYSDSLWEHALLTFVVFAYRPTLLQNEIYAHLLYFFAKTCIEYTSTTFVALAL